MKIPIMIAMAVLVLSIGANFALGDRSVIDAYNSGYKHGCSDAQIEDSHDRYIAQDGKGPRFHTDEFMNGYWTGREACVDHNGDHEDEGYYYTPDYGYQTVSKHDDDNRDVSCGDWKNGKNNCYVDGKLVVLNSPNHVDTLTQAQSQSQHVTCITIFSICGNNNEQGMAQTTSLQP